MVAPEQAPPDPGWVYFIGAYDGPELVAVKIGHSATPVERAKELGTASPFPVSLITALPGGVDLERKYQHRFRGVNIHREWFRPAPSLLEEIGRIKSIPGTYRKTKLSKKTLAVREQMRARVLGEKRAAGREAQNAGN